LLPTKIIKTYAKKNIHKTYRSSWSRFV
jgi:hypothetical protein